MVHIMENTRILTIIWVRQEISSSNSINQTNTIFKKMYEMSSMILFNNFLSNNKQIIKVVYYENLYSHISSN